MSKITLFIIFVLLCKFNFQAQSYSFKSYSIAEGLAQTQVKAITEDNNGYLWIGTLGGLSRFNGSNFENFSSEDGLLNNRITALYYLENQLWIGHKGGVSLFKNGKFFSWSLGQINKNVEVSSFIFFKNKLIIATNGSGLYSLENNKVTAIPLESDDANRIRGIELVDKELLIASRAGLYRSKNLKHFELIKTNEALNLTGITKKANTILVTTTNGEIFEYKKDRKIFVQRVKTNQELYLYSCFVDSKQNIWSTSNAGLIFKNSRNPSLLINEQLGLPFDALNCVYEDLNGTIWIGSDGKGLFRFSGMSFLYFDQKNGIQSNLIISSLQKSKNEFYFGTYDKGLVHYKDRVFKAILSEKTKFWASILDESGVLYLGTDNGLIQFQNGKSKVFKSLPEDENEKITCFYKTKNKTVLFGGSNGIGEIKWGKTSYLKQKFDATKIGTIRNIIQFKNKILCAADGGLFEFKNGEFKLFLNQKTTTFSLKMDDLGTLWIGGEAGLFASDGQKIERISLSDQPASNFVNFINFSKGRVFVGTNNGLYVLTNLIVPKNATKTRFGIEDGLVNLETNINSSTFDTDGNFWFGTAEGLVCFYMNGQQSINKNNTPFLNIRSVKINFQDIDYTKYSNEFSEDGIPLSMVLPPNKNNITLELNGVLLKDYKSLKYEYWLEGLDESWVPAFSSSLISLSNLPSGDYILHLRAKNEQGIYSQEKKIKLTIKPYFYKTWWFILLCILVLSLIIYLIFKSRIKIEQEKRYKEKLEFKSRLMSLEQQSLNASMNRHFIFNSLNSIQYFINTQDKLSANKYLTNFAKLIRKNLDSSSENNNQIALNQEIERLELYLSLEAMRFKDRFDYQINTGNIDMESIEVPAMLFQPFVENSIIHGILPNESQKGLISINLSIEENNDLQKLVVCIEDNGVGIEKSLLKKGIVGGDHKSQGMEITQKRISLLNKLSRQDFELEGPFQIEDDNRLIKGTRVLIKIPLKNLVD